MRHTVYKVFWAWQHEKEEDWLNRMSAMGLQLVGVGLCKYVFEDGPQNSYLYRLEFLDNWPSRPESVAYIRFLEEAGVEHIGNLFRWAYFRRAAGDGEFDLYSDLDSKISHFRRIRRIMSIIGAANIIPFISNFSNYIQSFKYQSGGITPLLAINLIYIPLAIIYFTMFTSLTRRIMSLEKEKKLRE